MRTHLPLVCLELRRDTYHIHAWSAWTPTVDPDIQWGRWTWLWKWRIGLLMWPLFLPEWPTSAFSWRNEHTVINVLYGRLGIPTWVWVADNTISQHLLISSQICTLAMSGIPRSPHFAVLLCIPAVLFPPLGDTPQCEAHKGRRLTPKTAKGEVSSYCPSVSDLSHISKGESPNGM